MTSAGENILGKLFQKPQCIIDGKKGETLTCAPSPNEMFYVRRCSDSKVTVGGACAKCIIENCENVGVDFQDRIVSGTMELINSRGVTVSIAKGHEVPTISADSCHDVHLHFHEPQGMGSLYTAKCSNVFIHFQPPNLEEQKLALPSADVDSQYITRCSEGKVVSVMAVREGAGYVTTQKEREDAEKKQVELERKMEDYAKKMAQEAIGRKPRK